MKSYAAKDNQGDVDTQVPYSFLRTREFEGTPVEDASIGTWGINYQRICKFYEELDKPVWDGPWPPKVKASDFDKDPALRPLPYYRRVYSFRWRPLTARLIPHCQILKNVWST